MLHLSSMNMKRIFIIILGLLILLPMQTVFAAGGYGAQQVEDQKIEDRCKLGETKQGGPNFADSSLDEKNSAVISFLAQVKAVTDFNAKPENKDKQKTYPSITIRTCIVDGKTIVAYTSGTAADIASIKAIPGLFDGDNPICDLMTEGIVCTSNSTTQSKLKLPTCELFEQAVTSRATNSADVRAKFAKYACTEFVEPVPSTFFTIDGADELQPYCIEKVQYDKEKALAVSFVRVNTSDAKDSYCDALLTPTGDGFTGIFGIVRLIYDISLPILIALSVISLVGVGVFIMYAPAGGEESIKKAKTMGIRILSGFLLLLLLRVFLGLISVDLFGAEPPTAASTSSPAGGATGK